MTEKRNLTFAAFIIFWVLSFVWLPGCSMAQPGVAGELVIFSDDGGWNWIEDERVLLANGNLIIGSVSQGRDGKSPVAGAEVTTYNLATGLVSVQLLHQFTTNVNDFQNNDHNSGALAISPDGRIIYAYSAHNNGNLLFNRSKVPHYADSWENQIEVDPTPSSGLNLGTPTYSALHIMGDQRRIYNFFRGSEGVLARPQRYVYSDDNGLTWQLGGTLIRNNDDRPYTKYASNGTNRIHFVHNETHPRDSELNYNGGRVWNSLYHGYIEYDRDTGTSGIYDSNGKYIKSLDGIPIEGKPDHTFNGITTPIFAADAVSGVSWINDVEIDSRGNPYVAFQVQKDTTNAGNPAPDGKDHRYHYARWDGVKWHQYEIAFGGTGLQLTHSGNLPAENDYTGCITLDPNSPNIVYISTDVHPVTGFALISETDNKQHHEIYKGITSNGGRTWSWTALTWNSVVDNIRPTVADWDRKNTALVWLRGAFQDYITYDLQVVGLITLGNEEKEYCTSCAATLPLLLDK